MSVSAKVNEPSFCPCCGRPSKVRQSPEWLLLHIGGSLGSVVAKLIECRREKRSASLRELCEAVYADRDKMPVNGHTSVAAAIVQRRHNLWNHGWDIVGPHVTGAGYCLVPLEINI